jgi:broad specificity polyphosphatase/5'/3'-nucleotidase SurE
MNGASSRADAEIVPSRINTEYKLDTIVFSAARPQLFAQSTLHAATTPLLNVNFPIGPFQDGRVTRVGRQVYDERVIPRIDPNGRSSRDGRQ